MFVKDSGIEVLGSILELKAGPSVLARMVSNPTSVKKATFRRKIIRGLKDQKQENWAELARLEALCNNYFDSIDATTSTETLHKDAIGQLSFQGEPFQALNQIPFFLFTMAMFKIYAVPAMALLMPVFTLVLPYVLIRYVYNLPIPIDKYIEIMKTMWFGKDQSWIQVGLFAFSMIQGIIQPIQNALHYRTTYSVVCEVGTAIIHLKQRIDHLRARLTTPFRLTTVLDAFPVDDPRRCFMMVFENRVILKEVFENLASLELLWKLSHSDEFKEVTFHKGFGTYLKIEGLQDMTIDPSIRIKSSVLLTPTSHHCLVTGPNGGGKSSSMRAVLQSVIMAQTFGIACVDSMSLRPFRTIVSGLNIHDTPGKKSMFEAEVRFAAGLLKARQGNTLVLYDELFHSTNPPDCVRTARIFLNRLWSMETVASFVSTHVFELVEEAPPQIQRLCVKASWAEKRLRFSYKLDEGVCKVSSVYTILKREGLLLASTANAVKLVR